jgi:hypothetical protein
MSYISDNEESKDSENREERKGFRRAKKRKSSENRAQLKS